MKDRQPCVRESDHLELSKRLPRIAEIQVEVDPKSGRALATVQKGDSGELAMFLRSPVGMWQRFADYKDRLIQAAFGPHGNLYVVSRQGAPKGKILPLPAAQPDLAKAAVVIPERSDAIVSDPYLPPGEKTVLPTATRLYVMYQLGGPSAIRAFTLRVYTGTPLPAAMKATFPTCASRARVSSPRRALAVLRPFSAPLC